MNYLERAESSIREVFEESGLTFEYENKGNELCVKATIEAEQVGDFLYSVHVYESGMVTFTMVFDEIKDSATVHKLLNDFNKDAFLLYACADEFLMLEHTVYKGLDPDIIGEYMADILDELNDEELLELLMPLIKLTF